MVLDKTGTESDAAENGGEHESAAALEHAAGSIGTRRSRCGTVQTVKDLVGLCRRRRCGGRAGHGRRGLVLVGWWVGTTSVVLEAVGGACVVLTAGLGALSAPFRAGEVGQGQGVLGDVGLNATAADAAIGQGFRVTSVDLGGSSRVLRADDGASAQLTLAPVGTDAERDRIRFDVVVGMGDGGEDGGNSQDGRSERKHAGGCRVVRTADITGLAKVLL